MPLSPRLLKLKERLFTQDFISPKEWYFADADILTDDAVRAEPLVIRKAMMFACVAENLPIKIFDDELIVGVLNSGGPAVGTLMPRYATDEELAHARDYFMDQNSVWGHHPPDWELMLTHGVIGVKRKINKKMAALIASPLPDEEKLALYRAMLISLDALCTLARRYAQSALRMSLLHADPIRRRELYDMYLVCSRVPEYPAQNFQEALQGIWFTYCLLASGAEHVPFGTADRYLYPFYINDLESGKHDKSFLRDLLGSFLVKCNERVLIDPKMGESHTTFGTLSLGIKPNQHIEREQTGGALTGAYDQRLLTWRDDEDIHSDANYNYGQSVNNWLMNLILAGTGKDGTDATNELSYLFIELVHEMSLVMPTLAIRVSPQTPQEFLKHAARVLRYGQGEPAIYNDEIIIPGLLSIGIPPEDARSYSNDGCWEVLIPGKSYFTYSHVMNIQCVEWVLHRGKTLLKDGLWEGLDTGDPCGFHNFEAFYAAYLRQVDNMLRYFYKRRIDSMHLTRMIAPDPLMSSLTHDCIEKGKDITEGGNRYTLHMMLCTGLANTVDSLAVIKKLVFEERAVSMETLIEATACNWQGYERLRAHIMHGAAKFGCDNDYADSIASRVLNDFASSVQSLAGEDKSLMLMCGIGTFENYALLGRGVAASADGRMDREALAPNYSPVPGRDIQGPTAAMKSITKSNLNNYFGGCPLDLALLTSEFDGESGIERLVSLIRSFCALGGQILTITGCNVEDLKNAMKYPEQYQHLRVRMGGLSAYFVAMAPEQQQNIIKRFGQ